ncbi:uncharacterized protein PV09_04610 [Verruconis gallopava]|uniref:Uncharacterized protein n=1 Tax=Verruconis gallopava TaxID=253628 RepID=A0A0D2ABU9_9PEZI|nr:uncharacterized protein PV09_04610 [Verruconis gallopava]KIW04318.1 hypothetical protein PV09_04610 [Verruconis gallopava]
MMAQQLAGKNILVTGGSSGLGRAYVEAFRNAGCQVIYGDLIEASDLPGFLHCDVSSWESQLKFFESAVEKLGRIDAVIANAGIANKENFNDYEDVELQPPTRPRTSIVDVNLTGVIFSAKLSMHYFARQWREHDSIPNFKPIFIIGGSLAGYLDMPMSPIYSSTKFALRGLLCSLRNATSRIGARVAMIAPWHVETPQLGVQAVRLKEQGIPVAQMADVVGAVQRLILEPSSNGKCFAAVPRTVKAPNGYFDVDEAGQDEFWRDYNEMLISEDERPLPQRGFAKN